MKTHKIWSRIATMALLVVVMLSFSACSLFTTDLDKKYSPNTLVAMAENGNLSVSRQELYYGYLQWGYQYAEQMEKDDLLEYVTTALLNNKILEQKSQEQFGDLRDAEKALALQQTYTSMDNTLRSYIYEALNVDDPEAADDDETATDDVDTPYEPSILVKMENGERVYLMDLSAYEDTNGTGVLSTADYQTYVPTVPGVASQKNVRQAVSKMVRNLQSFEAGFTKLKTPEHNYLADSPYFTFLSQDEKDVLNREIERMVQSNQTSIMAQRISTAYNLGLHTLSGEDAKIAWDAYLARSRDFTTWANRINGVADGDADLPAYFGCGRAVATNMAQKVIQYYQEMVANAINQQKNFPDSNLESTVMSSGLADVYYLPTDVANNLFTVSHILVGFTDEQKTEYKKIQSEAAQNPSYNGQNALNQLYAATKDATTGKSVYEILIELQTALNKTDDVAEKCQIFRSFINQYNTDPGMQNLDQLNSSTQKPQYEYLMSGTAENNSMVETFTEASLDLFENGIKGEISEIVWSEYGAHIIMYTRDVADFIFTGLAGEESRSLELLKRDYADTLFNTLTSYGHRTAFDTLVDSIATRSVDNYRYFLLNDYKSEHEITIYNHEFKDFL